MVEVKSDLLESRARYQDLAFKIFAVLGFLSSIVTIGSWLSTTQPSLSAIINPTTIEIPSELQVSNLEGVTYNLSSAVDDLSDRCCNPVEVDYRGETSRNYHYSVEKCEESERFLDAVVKTANLAGKKLVAWDIRVSNDGK